MSAAARERERFLEERRSMLGGSDSAALFNLPPYGCRRRVVYEKRGVIADFPFAGNKDTARGTALEPFVAKLYREQTGRRCRRVPLIRRPDAPYIAAHLDRLIEPTDGRDGPGALSIKCPTVRVFVECKRGRVPDYYLTQIQYEMLVAGLTWGGLAIFSAELWELLTPDVERDDELCARLEAEAHRTWREVNNGPLPDRLDAGDRRCQSCPYRTTCQGAALLAAAAEHETEDGDDLPRDESLAPLVRDFLEAKEVREAAETLEAEARNRLASRVGDRPAVDAGNARVFYRPSQRKNLDVAAIRRDHGDLCEQYDRVSVTRSLRVLSH